MIYFGDKFTRLVPVDYRLSQLHTGTNTNTL